MGSASYEARIAAPIGRVWDVIVDYARYAEFVPGVMSTRVLGASGGVRQVEYEVDVGLRRLRYVLALREEPPARVSWSLVRGELLLSSNGSWELTEDGTGTLARYSAEVRISRPPLVPAFVVDRLVEELTRVQVPAIVRAFKARAEGAA